MGGLVAWSILSILYALLVQTSHLLEVLLLLLGVGVIKAHDELALKRDLVVLVEQRGLGVADVQISAHREAATRSRSETYQTLFKHS